MSAAVPRPPKVEKIERDTQIAINFKMAANFIRLFLELKGWMWIL
jgi:hypothetical protein